jgi:hypothetical protein
MRPREELKLNTAIEIMSDRPSFDLKLKADRSAIKAEGFMKRSGRIDVRPDWVVRAVVLHNHPTAL